MPRLEQQEMSQRPRRHLQPCSLSWSLPALPCQLPPHLSVSPHILQTLKDQLQPPFCRQAHPNARLLGLPEPHVRPHEPGQFLKIDHFIKFGCAISPTSHEPCTPATAPSFRILGVSPSVISTKSLVVLTEPARPCSCATCPWVLFQALGTAWMAGRWDGGRQDT